MFFTLVVGVAKLGDINAVGRIEEKHCLWFICASLMSLMLGMILVNLFKPGLAMNLPLPEAGTDIGVPKAAVTLKEFLYHVFPSSVIESMAKNEILQIVVFSLFFGIATAAIGELRPRDSQGIRCHCSCYFKNNRICNEICTVGSVWCHDGHYGQTGTWNFKKHIQYLSASFILDLLFYG